MTYVIQGSTKHEPYLPLLPAAEHHHPSAGTRCVYPRRDEFTWMHLSLMHTSFVVYISISDVNKDWTHKDQDKDLTYKDSKQKRRQAQYSFLKLCH